MMKFGMLLVAAFFFVNAGQSVETSHVINMTNEEIFPIDELKGFVDIKAEFEKQAEAIQRQAMREVEETKNEIYEIIETVKQIEAGKTPSGLNSANTTFHTKNVNGRTLNITKTIYSTGSGEKTITHTVRGIYVEGTEADWRITTMKWFANQLIRRSIRYTPQFENIIYEAIDTQGWTNFF